MKPQFEFDHEAQLFPRSGNVEQFVHATNWNQQERKTNRRGTQHRPLPVGVTPWRHHLGVAFPLKIGQRQKKI